MLNTSILSLVKWYKYLLHLVLKPVLYHPYPLKIRSTTEPGVDFSGFVVPQQTYRLLNKEPFHDLPTRVDWIRGCRPTTIVWPVVKMCRQVTKILTYKGICFTFDVQKTLHPCRSKGNVDTWQRHQCLGEMKFYLTYLT